MVQPVILVHAGAGRYADELRDREPECRAALERALESACEALSGGGDAVAAVCAAVEVMEAFPLFNAAHGAALCADGSVELSAAVMRGSDRAAGAVAGVSRARHPIAAARALLDESEVLIFGPRADAFAAARGVRQADPEEFVTADQRRRLQERQAGDRGTVGAVCLDLDGWLAAATSTGGLLGQRPGRVGDTPLIGAGTWADQRAAVSCTGEGEAFIRAGVGRLLGCLIEHGATIGEAGRTVLAEVAMCGGTGGLIALDRDGNATTPFTTEAMPRGTWRAGGPMTIEIP
jgi:beta-aspartyl-peptidase (threonine type)